MYKIFVACLSIFWIFDILNMPFMQMFDTTYPVNFWAWLLIWLFIPGCGAVSRCKTDQSYRNT